MKIETPLTPEKAYEEAKLILARTGHKLFTPSWLYFKLDRGLIGVRPFKRSVFYIALHKGKVVICGMHNNHHDTTVLKEIRDNFKPFVKYKPRQLRRFRDDSWDSLHEAITPTERGEFAILIQDTRLSSVG